MPVPVRDIRLEDRLAFQAEAKVLHIVGHRAGSTSSPHFSQTFIMRRRIAACLLRCTAISLLDIVSTMPSSQNRRAPRIQATLRRLITKVCEKCGLVAAIVPERRAAASTLCSGSG